MIRQRTQRRTRHVADMPIKATVLRAKGRRAVSGRCTVIGETGLGCYLSAALVLGELLELELPIPDTPIRAVAEIRSQSGDYYGLEFIGLKWEQRDAIIRYCRRLPIKSEKE